MCFVCSCCLFKIPVAVYLLFWCDVVLSCVVLGEVDGLGWLVWCLVEWCVGWVCTLWCV